MQLNKKGFVWLPVLLVILVVLAASGGAWWYEHQKESFVIDTEHFPQPATTTDETVGWKTYVNTQHGFSIQYPATWTVEEGTSIVARLHDPATGKADSSVPGNTVLASYKPTPCMPSDWASGVGGTMYKTGCASLVDPLLRITMSAITPQAQEVEDRILQSLTFPNRHMEVSVPGMSKYTDTDFGFSFWYPSGWSVQEITPTTGNQKSLRIKSPQSLGTQWSEVTIEEVSSPDGSVKFSGYNSAKWGPINAVEYFFDSNTHTWMLRYPDGISSETTGRSLPAGYTQAADVSINTMGGLHIFSGNVPNYGPDAVPLTAHNFLLVSTATPVDTVDWTKLLMTIVATDPAVATPVSAAEQIKIIQAEKDAYTQ